MSDATIPPQTHPPVRAEDVSHYVGYDWRMTDGNRCIYSNDVSGISGPTICVVGWQDDVVYDSTVILKTFTEAIGMDNAYTALMADALAERNRIYDSAYVQGDAGKPRSVNYDENTHTYTLSGWLTSEGKSALHPETRIIAVETDSLGHNILIVCNVWNDGPLGPPPVSLPVSDLWPSQLEYTG